MQSCLLYQHVWEEMWLICNTKCNLCFHWLVIIKNVCSILIASSVESNSQLNNLTFNCLILWFTHCRLYIFSVKHILLLPPNGMTGFCELFPGLTLLHLEFCWYRSESMRAFVVVTIVLAGERGFSHITTDNQILRWCLCFKLPGSWSLYPIQSLTSLALVNCFASSSNDPEPGMRMYLSWPIFNPLIS